MRKKTKQLKQARKIQRKVNKLIAEAKELTSFVNTAWYEIYKSRISKGE